MQSEEAAWHLKKNYTQQNYCTSSGLFYVVCSFLIVSFDLFIPDFKLKSIEKGIFWHAIKIIETLKKMKKKK